MTTMTIIPEIIEEAVESLANHYGASKSDVLKAYLADVGSVRSEVHAIYAKVCEIL